MIEAYLDFDSKIKLMITNQNNIILFDTFDFNGDTLNKLYKILSELCVESVITVMHAIYDKECYDNVYRTETYQIGDNIYTGVLSQLDINKLMCVFNAAKITNIRFCDKMIMYNHFLRDNQCLVDSTNNTNIVVSKNMGGVSDIIYVKSSMLEQSLLQTCRKNNTKDIVNFNTFVDYDCVKQFTNFVKVEELSIFVTLTVFGFFKFINSTASIDLNQVRFNSKLETVNYETKSLKSDKVLKGPIIHKKVQQSNENTSSVKVKEKQKPVKVKKSHRQKPVANILINLLIVLLLFSLASTFIVKHYYNNKARGPEDLIIYNTNIINHTKLRINKLQESPVTNTSQITNDIITRCPVDISIGSIIIENDIEIVYYVAETATIDSVLSTLEDNYKVNAISESGIVTLNNINYSKYVISVSTK